MPLKCYRVQTEDSTPLHSNVMHLYGKCETATIIPTSSFAHFSHCSPNASASAVASQLRPFQLLLPNCFRFSCCSLTAAVSTCDHAYAVQSILSMKAFPDRITRKHGPEPYSVSLTPTTDICLQPDPPADLKPPPSPKPPGAYAPRAAETHASAKPASLYSSL